MRRLTPELYAISTFDGLLTTETEAIETRELDFNLSRRSGVLINQLQSLIQLSPAAADGAGYAAQELDMDPNNIQIWRDSPTIEGVEYDTSRLLRHEAFISHSNTAGWTIAGGKEVLVRKWSNYPLELRPLSITSMRHHVGVGKVTGLGMSYHAELMIYYYIVELTLEELGIVNASRR